FIPLDNWFRFFRRVHFARYGETSWARWGWIIVSFLPTVLFISGFTLWWQRVVLGRGKSKSETKS
ncbi:MAG: PepSY domain-containing protein, partial [Gammaproteobacteria bacterium]